MCPSHWIVYISDGCVKWVEVVLPCGDRDRCFVTSENHWCEHCSMCLQIFSYFILEINGFEIYIDNSLVMKNKPLVPMPNSQTSGLDNAAFRCEKHALGNNQFALCSPGIRSGSPWGLMDPETKPRTCRSSMGVSAFLLQVVIRCRKQKSCPRPPRQIL